MKQLLSLLPLLFLPVCTAIGQSSPIRRATEQTADRSARLWGIRFEPDLLLLSPASQRMVIVRYGETMSACDTTALPTDIPIANSVTNYRGRRYVTLVSDWFDKRNAETLLELTAHESFHFYQDSLGIEAVTSQNSHLDTPQGRALLHMEFDALRRALRGSRRALKTALQIREERRRMFPDNNESTFEKHEGTAQYTGLRIAYTKDRTIRHMAIRRLRYEAKKGYVNSFAYATGPAYALLLDRINPAWRSGIATAEGLSEAAADALSETKTNKDSSSPTAKKRMEATRSDSYARYLKAERKTAGDSSRYTGWLASDANVLRIPNDGIHISFNPNDRVIPLADRAVVLRNVTLRGKWGTLVVKQGLVRMNDRSEERRVGKECRSRWSPYH